MRKLAIAIALIVATIPSQAMACGAACNNKPYPTAVVVQTPVPAPVVVAPAPPPPAPPGPPQNLDRVAICVHENGLVLTKLLRGSELDVWLSTHPQDFRQPQGGDCGVTRPEVSTPAPVVVQVVVPAPVATPESSGETEHPQQPLPGTEVTATPAVVEAVVPVSTQVEEAAPTVTPNEAVPVEVEEVAPPEIVVPVALPVAGDGQDCLAIGSCTEIVTH